ncbi:MAG: WecB/TagA/CpsF family glycosyltransferase [Acidobacteria bacterium]|nr:WecB/TagA/CpsF family glycosyltransferase [Acidobacteriota bacterium]
MSASGHGETRVLFGVPIDAVSMTEVMDRVDEAIVGRRRLQIGVVNAAKLVNMRRDPTLQHSVLSSDLILADGMAVVWASRILRAPLPERVAGIDVMTAILERANRLQYRIYCLGATQAVLDAVAVRMAAEYPGARLVGRHHGYFSPEEEPEVADDIGHSGADILLVAMTSPKKEEFLARWSDRLGVPVCHGVGGSFDVFAGKVRRAPAAWQRLGLEWLYRVKQEPARLWKRYLFTNAAFCWMTVREAAGTLLGAGSGKPASGADGDR